MLNANRGDLILQFIWLLTIVWYRQIELIFLSSEETGEGQYYKLRKRPMQSYTGFSGKTLIKKDLVKISNMDAERSYLN